ncbi:MAG: hypothetical protein R3F59_17840 [Myxococcota bacterium]
MARRHQLLRHRLLRPRAAGALALAVSLVWLLSSIGSLVHPFLVQHTVCPEHGELAEIHPHAATASPHDRDHGPVATAGDQAHPDHDCAISSLPSPSAPTPVLAPQRSRSRHVAALARGAAGGPRAPPLGYAPKTSPPHPTLG